MSDETRNEANAPQPTPPKPPVPEKKAPAPEKASPAAASARRRKGGSGAGTALALLLSVVALGGVAWGGWHLWQLERGGRSDSRSVDTLRHRVDTLEGSLQQVRQERAGLKKRLDDAGAVNRGLRQQVLGLGERTRNLEDAVANLSDTRLSGHDSMLLDEAGMLLRMGQERYTLFHDAQGALKAYDLADKALAGVDDSAFAGVRQSLDAEREALSATHPGAHARDLAALSALRGELADLPPRPLDAAAGPRPQGFWQRTWRALSTLVTVNRDNGAPVSVADAHMARELAALDVAQAEAALLAHDTTAYGAALDRVIDALETDFDGNDGGVRQALAQVRRLRADVRGSQAIQLGGALDELRDLRDVRDAGHEATGRPAPSTTAPSTAPAPAGSTGMDVPAGARS